MHIVTCVDSSRQSIEAAEAAASLCEKLDGQLTLVHTASTGIERTQQGDAIRETYTEGGSEETLPEEIAEELSLSCDTKVIVSEPGEEVNSVTAYLTSEQPDYVFLGHRAMSDRHETMFGSFTKSLIGTSPVPVTVVSDT